MQKSTRKKTSVSAAKNAAWKEFSRYIRLRDCIKTTGDTDAGICITCGKLIPYGNSQAGHFIAGRTNGVLFNEDIYMVFGSAKNMFDLVIGSPPFIRIRHMSPDWYEIIRKFHAFDIGNAYTAFYVFGLYMLNKTGRLVYISPNGFMRDTTDRDLRDFILRKGLLKSICDFRSSKIFPDVSACFCICSFFLILITR